jgi:hypothetical protein
MCEAEKGGIAVHCKAGLGRTGTCIGAYAMKHYGFTAREAIGWFRICRPGTVLGAQQQYMEVRAGVVWGCALCCGGVGLCCVLWWCCKVSYVCGVGCSGVIYRVV